MHPKTSWKNKRPHTGLQKLAGPYGTCPASACRLSISCSCCCAAASDEELCAWSNVRVESEFPWEKQFVLSGLRGEQRLASTDAKSTRPKLPIFQMLSLSCSEFVFQLLYLTGSKKAIPTLAYQKKILKPPNKCAILKINAYSKSSLTTSISIVRLMNITPPYQTLPKANMFSIFNHFGRFFGSLTGL